MTIREVIIEKRAEVGMTQRELSEKTGITQARISDFESGKRTMTSDNIDKIFNVLDIHFVRSKEQMWDLAKECANILKQKGKSVADTKKLTKDELADLTGKEEILYLDEYSEGFYDENSARGIINELTAYNYVIALVAFHRALLK